MKKRVLSVVLLALVALSLTACEAKETVSSATTVSTVSADSTSVSEASTEQEPEPEAKEVYFSVQDVFTITLNEVQYTVVTGYPVGGTIYVDDALVLETDGETIETKVVSFESLQGEHPTSVGENEAIAVWIDKYLSETVKAGDKMVDVSVK